MMSRMYKTLALLLLANVSGLVCAQQHWTFDEVLRSALVSHPSIQSSRSSQQAAQAEREGAQWARYPTPSVEAQQPDSGSGTTVARLDQPLWTGGRISANIDAASSRFQAAGSAVHETALDLSLRVITAATEALRQKARLEHAAHNVQEHDKLLGMIKRRVTQEVSSQTDQRLAESRYFQAANDLSLTKQGLQQALAQLSQLAGQPVSDIAIEPPNAATLPADLNQAIGYALHHSPLLKRLAYEEEAAQAEIRARRAAYFPQIGIRLERAYGAFDDSRAMLVLQAQPGAGLSAASGVEAAVARREALRLSREAAQREISERVTLDWQELTAAQARLDNATLSHAITGEVAESYKRQYVIGRKSWLDVLNAVRESTQAQYALEDARMQVLAAGLRLRALTGTLNSKL